MNKYYVYDPTDPLSCWASRHPDYPSDWIWRDTKGLPMSLELAERCMRSWHNCELVPADATPPEQGEVVLRVPHGTKARIEYF